MNRNNNYLAAINIHNRQLLLVFKSIFIGAGVAVVTVLYRLVLEKAESVRTIAFSFALKSFYLIPLVFITVICIGIVVGFLVKKFPPIGGSGIPQVKGQIAGHYFSIDWKTTLVAKFIGGALSILAGLSLGRAGPSIQLGACTAQGFGEKFSPTRTERKILIASGVSAGLAAAFNAPLAGVIFAFEEIFKYYSPIVLLSTMTASVTADFVSKMVFGLEPVFNFSITRIIGLDNYWLLVILGVVVGAAGCVYNYILLKTMAVYNRIGKFNQTTKILVPFVVAGFLGLTFPLVLGGGERILDFLKVDQSLSWIVLVLLIKFGFFMISFGAGVPGGMFFPLLVIGALLGGVFGKILILNAVIETDLFNVIIILAMAGFFTSIVHAPITGVILMTEMTGSLGHLLPLTVVAVSSYITAEMLKSIPIYDSLLEMQLKNSEQSHYSDLDNSKKIVVSVVVRHGSKIDGMNISDLSLPDDSLVIAVRRMNKDIIPHGSTKIHAEDNLEVLTGIQNEATVREALQNQCKIL